MKDHVMKRGRTWSYYVELPPPLSRDCPGKPDRHGKLRTHRSWVDVHAGDNCPICGQPLGAAVRNE